MIARDLISEIIPAIDTDDTGHKALNWMEIFRVSHLPIVCGDEFLGVISDNDIYDFNIADNKIVDYKLSLYRPYIYEDQHIYEIIEIASRLKLSVIPVLDKENKYKGVITLHDLVKYFSELIAVNSPGAVIVLEMSVHNYSLTQIANIIEGNNAKILSLYLKNISDTSKIEVTIKVNTDNLSSILQTLDRYDYIVKASYMEDDSYRKIFEDRYETFMNYINI